MANPSDLKEGRSSGDGHSSSKSSSKGAPMPKDAQVMAAVLRDMGVTEYEPKVVSQLLEFSYRYVTDVLEDARAVSNHARKKAVDLEDVRLAVRMHAEQNVTSPPSREVLLDVARAKNSTPLPIPKPTCGLRLPPDRHCLTACNYRIKFKSRPKPPGYGGGGAARYSTPGTSKMVGGMGMQPKMVIPHSQPAFSLTRPPGMGLPGMGPKPVIKFNPGPQAMPNIQITPQQTVDGNSTAAGQPMFKISVAPQALGMTGPPQPTKRKADEMNSY